MYARASMCRTGGRRSKGQGMGAGEELREALCHGEGCPSPLKVPITLTYVLYDQGDVLGLLLAWFSLLPMFVLVGFIALILFHRDLHTIFYLIGVVLNEGINFAIKHVIKEPRPATELTKGSLFVEYGMPSSHAQFMAFFSTYFIMFVFIRVVLSAGGCDFLWKGLAAFVATVAAIGSSASRVYLGYHSVAQVLCGVGAGCVLGVAWFLVVHFLISPLFPMICSWKISELVLLKEVSHIPNYLWFEYTSARGETRKRIRTKST